MDNIDKGLILTGILIVCCIAVLGCIFVDAYSRKNSTDVENLNVQKNITDNSDITVYTINGHRYLRLIGGAKNNMVVVHEASCEMHDIDSVLQKNSSNH